MMSTKKASFACGLLAASLSFTACKKDNNSQTQTPLSSQTVVNGLSVDLLELPNGQGYLHLAQSDNASGQKEFVLVKTTVGGQLIWRRSYGQLGLDYLPKQVLLQSNGYLLAGEQVSNSQHKIVLLAVDTAGTLSNTQVLRTNRGGNDYFAQLIALSAGGFALTGSTDEVDTLKPGYPSAVSSDVSDVLVMKLQANLALDWEFVYGFVGADKGLSLHENTDLYVASSVQNTNNNRKQLGYMKFRLSSGGVIEQNTLTDSTDHAVVAARFHNNKPYFLSRSGSSTYYWSRLDLSPFSGVTASISLSNAGQVEQFRPHRNGVDFVLVGKATNNGQEDALLLHLSESGAILHEKYFDGGQNEQGSTVLPLSGQWMFGGTSNNRSSLIMGMVNE